MPSISLTDAVTSASVTWSREGYIPEAIVMGGRNETETSFFKDNSSFGSNLPLKEMWTGSPSEATKETDGATSDDYVKFAPEPEDVAWFDIDGPEDGEGPTLYAFRDMINRTQDYADGNAKSGYAMVDDTTWQFSGKIGLSARISNEEIAYLKFQGGDRAVESQQKNNNKMFTGSVKGYFRLVAGSDPLGGFSGLVDGEFTPLQVIKADRFIKKTVFESYRDNPDGTAVSETVRDDQSELNEYSRNLAISNSVPTVSGSIQLAGRNYFGVGDILTSIESVEGDIDINLAMVSVDIQFQPPRPAGTPSGDATIIELGRV